LNIGFAAVSIVIGGSVTGSYYFEKCPNSESEDGFATAKLYAGVRFTANLLPVKSEWLSAEAFIEFGGFGSAKWDLVPLKYRSYSAGGYFRARAEFNFGWYSKTYEYSKTWCLFGDCSGGIDVIAE